MYSQSNKQRHASVTSYNGSVAQSHAPSMQYAPSMASGISMAPSQYSTYNTPPPRFRPYMILFMVLSIGLFLIGLIMTIIAVFPGLSQTGGNGLKIAGPIVLVCGAVLVMGGIVNSCFHSQNEKEKTVKRQQLIYARSVGSISKGSHRGSRSTLGSQNFAPSTGYAASTGHASSTGYPSAPHPQNPMPPKGILKQKPSSTSSYTSKSHEELGNMSNSFSIHNSYERDSGSDSSSTGMGHLGGVSMDPFGRSNRKSKGHSNSGYDSFEGGIVGQGSLMGPGSITGHGQLSPYNASAPPPVTQKKWGNNQQRHTTSVHSQQSSASSAIHRDSSPQGDISNVSETYNQISNSHSNQMRNNQPNRQNRTPGTRTPPYGPQQTSSTASTEV